MHISCPAVLPCPGRTSIGKEVRNKASLQQEEHLFNYSYSLFIKTVWIFFWFWFFSALFWMDVYAAEITIILFQKSFAYLQVASSCQSQLERKTDISQQRKNARASEMWNTLSCHKCINVWNYTWVSAVQKTVTHSTNNFLDSHFCVQSLYYKVWEGQIVWNYLLGWSSWFWSQQKTCPCCQFWELVYVLHLLVSSCCWQNSNGYKFFKLVDGRQNGPRENDTWFYEFKKKGVSISYFCIYCKM